MTWFNVDDGFYDHPKSFDASDAAVALWTRAGAWCARNLTDGFVPAGMLPRLSSSADNASKELCDRGLWKRTRGGFQYHDWPDYNRTADEVKAVRKSNAERQKRWRESKRDVVSNAVTDASTNGVTNSTQAKPSQALKEKEQLQPPQTSSGSPPRKRGTRLPEDFAVTPEMIDWARGHTPGVGRAETEKFRDYWRAASGPNAVKRDWVAAWRNWMRRAQEDLTRHGRPANGHKPNADQTIAELLGAQPALRALPGGQT